MSNLSTLLVTIILIAIVIILLCLPSPVKPVSNNLHDSSETVTTLNNSHTNQS